MYLGVHDYYFLINKQVNIYVNEEDE